MTTATHCERTFVVGDVRVDIVLYENANDVVTAHFTGVTERRSTGHVL